MRKAFAMIALAAMVMSSMGTTVMAAPSASIVNGKQNIVINGNFNEGDLAWLISHVKTEKGT